MPQLTFLGAARTVTGSKHLLDTGTHRVLVDCGLFQGLKDLRLRNWQPLPTDPADIHAVILTHAHIDHSGYLPRLVASGFKGRIFCTAGTSELCRLVLPDAGRLQEEEANQVNRGGYSKHRPALPLFREVDAFRVLTHLQPVGYERSMPVAPGVEAEFFNAGHLLGSAYVRVRVTGVDGTTTILFGGDLGRYDRPVLPDPQVADRADYLLVESTYGDRIHAKDDDGETLARIVVETHERGGRLIIPAFAIGRVEEVLFWLDVLEQAKRIPILPVYLDSPMAVEALAFYAARGHELDPVSPQRDVSSGHEAESAAATRDSAPGAHARPASSKRNGVTGAEAQLAPPKRNGVSGTEARAQRRVSMFGTERFRAVASARESQDLVASRGPAIVISSSGMATGGRVVNHLKEALPDSRNTVLFVGYQGAGTRGRRLLDGEPAVRIYGQTVPVAARIEKLDSMSAHADYSEILRWLRGFQAPPRTTFLVHGEPAPMDALKRHIEEQLNWQVRTPDYLERVRLE